MKKSIFIGLILLLFIRPVLGQDNKEPRLITIRGVAEIKVTPEEIQFNTSVETRGKDLISTKLQNDEKIKNVISTTKSFGITSNDINLYYLNIEPKYDDEGEAKNIKYYAVQKSITILLKDTSKFEEFITALLKSGITHINNIEYKHKDLRKFRDQARILALKAAREKATALAQEIEQKLGKVYSIKEENEFSRQPSNNILINYDRGGESTIEFGQITISSSIVVSFEID